MRIMSIDRIVREDIGAVAVVRINRPERKNAMTEEMLQAFVDHLEDIDRDKNVGAFVITGTGDAFLSGLDVTKVTAKVSDMSPAMWRQFRELTTKQFSTIQRSSKPSVAAINGPCVAGGFPVALACDVRVASRTAYFKMGYRRVGLMPSMNICFLLPYMIGLGRAKLLALTDRRIEAEEAARIGLVEMVEEPDEMLQTAVNLAQEMAAGAPLWVTITKETMNRAYGLDLDQLRRQVDYMQFMLGKTEDHVEAMDAFAEKREPKFKGR